jgi:hypothetical protein
MDRDLSQIDVDVQLALPDVMQSRARRPERGRAAAVGISRILLMTEHAGSVLELGPSPQPS